MGRNRHDKKEIEAAVRYAEDAGWKLDLVHKKHTWGKLKCPHYEESPVGDNPMAHQGNHRCRGGVKCKLTVNSTPRNESVHANQIRQAVDGCIGPNDDDSVE